MRTYEARLHLGDASALDAYGALFGRALHSLYAARRAGRDVAKPQFMRDFQLTARQCNAVKYTLDGIESSIRERRPGLLAELDARLTALDAKIAKTSSIAKRHHFQRRRDRLRLRRVAMENVTPRICFGSRKLFNAQHRLEENGFADHAAWQTAWKA